MYNDANLAMGRSVMERYVYSVSSIMKKNWSNRTFFLKSAGATVAISPSPNLNLFRQCKRWRSKNKICTNLAAFLVTLIVFMANLAVVVCLIAGFFQIHFLWLAAILWTAKMLVDYPLFTSLCRFWKIKPLLFLDAS